MRTLNWSKYYAAADVSNINPTEVKLRSFSSLPTGWHYGDGGPLSVDSVEKAIKLLNALTLVGFTSTDAFPGTSGEIALTAYSGDNFVEIVLEQGDSISIAYEKSNVLMSHSDNLDYKSAREALNIIALQIWNTCDYFTRNTTILKNVSSEAWRLKTAVGEAVSPLSSTPASRKPVLVYATT